MGARLNLQRSPWISAKPPAASRGDIAVPHQWFDLSDPSCDFPSETNVLSVHADIFTAKKNREGKGKEHTFMRN